MDRECADGPAVTLGKFAIGFYIRESHLSAAYGAAGSLVVGARVGVCAAQIFLLGAEFTCVYAKSQERLSHDLSAHERGSVARGVPNAGSRPYQRSCREKALLRHRAFELADSLLEGSGD